MKRPESYTDEELLAAYKSEKDLRIYASLFLRYEHLLYGVCLKYLENREDARDSVMNVFEKTQSEVLKNEIQVFRSWIYVVAKNHCLMKIRKDKKMIGVPLENNVPLHMESEDTWHPLLEEAHNMDMALDNCIKKLTLEQQQCIRGFYLDKMSYKDLATEHELDLKTVKSYIQNGKRNLKLCLESKIDG